jgi:hypothetical protein
MRIALLLSVLVLAGCGGDNDEPPARSTPAPSAGAPIPGGGLSVQQAIDSDVDGPLMVRGYLIERDGELRLCEAILESSPPQCGEPSLRVEGTAPAASEQRVSLLGEVEGETITVSETSTG